MIMKQRFFKEVKIVRTNKEHSCEVCGNPIPKGARTLVESGKSQYDGFYSCYIHTDEENKCYLDYLDCVQPSNSEDVLKKIKDSNFVGQISYDHWRSEV